MRRIGVIGAGKMGEALIAGLIKSGVPVDRLRVSDISAERRRRIQDHLHVPCYEDNARVAAESDILILAVPPTMAPAVLQDLRGRLAPHHLVISIAAGVPTRSLLEGVGQPLKLIRVMPNNPCLIGEGMIVLAPTPLATATDVAEATQLFTAMGRVAVTTEDHMDAVTGLSGSGPAYAYLVIEALADGGVKMGLPRALSLTLAAQTLAGAGNMVLETGKHPAELKDMVATPGGTTVQGLAALEAAGVRSAFIKAVEDATLMARNMLSQQTATSEQT